MQGRDYVLPDDIHGITPPGPRPPAAPQRRGHDERTHHRARSSTAIVESVPVPVGSDARAAVREALAALTVRGRAFLAAGITTVVGAIVVGHSSVVRIGVLVAVLPLLTALWIGRSRYRLALVRTVSPQLVVAGQPSTVELTATNESRTPTGVLLLEDHLPYVLGTRPRFVLEGIGHGWRRHATYQVRSEVRGHFEIGPMSVRVTRPLRPRRARPHVPHARPRSPSPRAPSRCRASRSAAPGPARATTGPAPSPPAAPRTSPSGSTAAATTCGASTGAARRASAS